MLPRKLDTVSHFLIVGLNRDGETISAIELDDMTHSLLTSSHEHHEIPEGATFRYSDSISLNSTQEQYYLISTPNTSKWAHFTFTVDGSAITSATLYEATNKVGDVAQVVHNANRNSILTNSTLVFKGVTGGSTNGVVLYPYKSGSATNQARSNANLDHASEIILKQNTKYILHIISDTNSNLININMDWYEHTSLPS